MTPRDHHLLRYSLVFVWLTTALVSVWELQGQSLQLLAGLNDTMPWLKPALILSGALVDLVLGLWLWLRPGRTVYRLALAVMLLMTGVATAIDPSLWLHPLGPLTKNVPIAALLLVLARTASPQTRK
jgi:hypothetical protein